MARRLRADMIAETRASWIAAAREAFGGMGYAAASMDEMTAAAGLTRGAPGHHHFGDKKGLFAAVIDQIDAEMTVRPGRRLGPCRESLDRLPRPSCAAYLAMAREPEIQRIMPATARPCSAIPGAGPLQNDCIRMMARGLDELVSEGVLAPLDPGSRGAIDLWRDAAGGAVDRACARSRGGASSCDRRLRRDAGRTAQQADMKKGASGALFLDQTMIAGVSRSCAARAP